MIARHPGLRLALMVTLSATFAVLAHPALAESADNGDWQCERSPSDGRWECKRQGEGSAAPASPADRSAPPVSEPALRDEPKPQAQPAEITEPDLPEPDPEPVSEPVAEPETLSPEPEPVAAAPEPARDAIPERAPDYDPVQSREPDNRPAYQSLAYVPDRPTSLLELPGDFWVAQLMAVSSKEFLEEYAAEHRLKGLSAARVASGDRLFYILILGIYETKDRAQRAITDLPPPYDTYSPFLRSLKSLQQAMKQADDIAGSAEF